MLVAQCEQAIRNVEHKITEEVHKGTARDRTVIKRLQKEHADLTRQLAALTEPDRETPKDKSDTKTKTPAAEPSNKPIDKGLQAYCQKCKTKRPMINPVFAPTKGGKNGAKGTCSDCNSNMFRLIKN